MEMSESNGYRLRRRWNSIRQFTAEGKILMNHFRNLFLWM